jgi:hypothetical protein
MTPVPSGQSWFWVSFSVIACPLLCLINFRDQMTHDVIVFSSKKNIFVKLYIHVSITFGEIQRSRQSFPFPDETAVPCQSGKPTHYLRSQSVDYRHSYRSKLVLYLSAVSHVQLSLCAWLVTLFPSWPLTWCATVNRPQATLSPFTMPVRLFGSVALLNTWRLCLVSVPAIEAGPLR